MKIFQKLKHNTGNLVRYFHILYLKLCGVKIGKKCMISLGAKIDVRRGSIIIGNNVTITHGVVILSHDAASSILKKKSSEAVTVIHDNVFIGVNSVILPGRDIGRNSIIGALSVVSTNIPESSIAFGNPAKVSRIYCHAQARD